MRERTGRATGRCPNAFLNPPQILYEDSQILVINKPSGMVVMAGVGHDHAQSLASWVEEHVGQGILGVGQAGRWGLMHRLDKDTSGVMVVAKTQFAHADLTYQFKERLVKKEYLALAWGSIGSDEKFSVTGNSKIAGLRYGWLDENAFEVRAPIGRNPQKPLRFTVLREGKTALTRFRSVKAFNKGLTLVKAYPVTGRTHQIRVHLKALGHPIVGDPIYSNKGKQQWAKHNLGLQRTFLHAQHLSFLHPASTKKVAFEAALPKDLLRVWEMLL